MSNSPNSLVHSDQQLIKTIKEISNTDSLKSRAALNELKEIIESPAKHAALEANAELFIENIVAQLKKLQQIPITNWLVSYQPLFTILKAFVDCDSLSKTLSIASLQSLMAALLLLMADQKLAICDKNKMINDICLKILEKSNFTHINCALIRLLRETCAAGSIPKFTDLLIKCICRNLKILQERSEELNYDDVIMEAHNFMLALPSCFWKARPSDTPMRTIKMILYNIAKLKGKAILEHLQRIPRDSELHATLSKMLQYLEVASIEDSIENLKENIIPKNWGTSNQLTFQAVFEKFVEDRLAQTQHSNVQCNFEPRTSNFKNLL